MVVVVVRGRSSIITIGLGVDGCSLGRDGAGWVCGVWVRHDGSKLGEWRGYIRGRRSSNMNTTASWEEGTTEAPNYCATGVKALVVRKMGVGAVDGESTNMGLATIAIW